jgi:hypothetical protein
MSGAWRGRERTRPGEAIYQLQRRPGGGQRAVDRVKRGASGVHVIARSTRRWKQLSKSLANLPSDDSRIP